MTNCYNFFLSQALHQCWREGVKDAGVLVEAVPMEGLCSEIHWPYPTHVCEDVCYIICTYIHKLEHFVCSTILYSIAYVHEEHTVL